VFISDFKGLVPQPTSPRRLCPVIDVGIVDPKCLEDTAAHVHTLEQTDSRDASTTQRHPQTSGHHLFGTVRPRKKAKAKVNRRSRNNPRRVEYNRYDCHLFKTIQHGIYLVIIHLFCIEKPVTDHLFCLDAARTPPHDLHNRNMLETSKLIRY
jgi:hypothetical protein